jgi:hypothetical protein
MLSKIIESGISFNNNISRQHFRWIIIICLFQMCFVFDVSNYVPQMEDIRYKGKKDCDHIEKKCEVTQVNE